jgi:hypothetical protein
VLKDVVEAKVLSGYRVYLRFEDGVAGELDLGNMIKFVGVFAKLRDQSEFAKLHVDPDAGTIVWPNGADLDPDVLYSAVSGEPIEATTGDGSVC